MVAFAKAKGGLLGLKVIRDVMDGINDLVFVLFPVSIGNRR